MSHMCTHLPDDPTLVLAIRVTEETYEDYYRIFTNGKRGRKLSLDTLEGNVIFVPVDSEASWGWMVREQFDEMYEPVNTWVKFRFTLCKAIKSKETVWVSEIQKRVQSRKRSTTSAKKR